MKNQKLNELRNAQKLEIKKLEEENFIMKKLSTNLGFYNYYFTVMKTSETQESAFNIVNELYKSLFKEYRYNDFNTFKNMTC